MADILLFGPHAAGKTQIYYSLQGMEYTDPLQTDQEEYSIKKDGIFGWIGLSSYSIQEIGGKDIYLYDKKYLNQIFKLNTKLVFVFNGNDLIEELKNYHQGGRISSLIRCFVTPALYENESDDDFRRDIMFIATHEDEYQGSEKDMETEIFTCLEKANEDYRKIANGIRYPFKKLLRGNLFCIDATDSKQVSRVFNQINKS